MNKLNQISMSQKLSYELSPGNYDNKKIALALAGEISTLGFKFDRKLLNVLATQSNAKLKKIKAELVKYLSTIVGDNVEYNPLFINFPDDVREDNEYFYKRFLGHINNYFYLNDADDSYAERLSCGCYIDSSVFDMSLWGACPICQYQTRDTLFNKKEKKPLTDKVVLKRISLIDRDGQIEIVKNLLDSKIAYSPAMKDNVILAVQELKEEIMGLLPAKIDNKENLAFISAVLLKTEETKKLFRANEYFKTATDILRLATALVAGDITLKEESKYRLTNSERKLVLSLLNSVKSPLEDMLRYRNKWLRLADYLHVGAYEKQYPIAAKNVSVLRNSHKTIDTFSKNVHKELAILKDTKDNEKIVNLLKSRPGELARRLDYIIRHSDESVIETFSQVVDSVPTALLLKLNSYFKTRNKPVAFRSFMPKGNLAKIHYLEGDSRETIKKTIINKIDKVIVKELKQRFSKNTELKNVYVDEKLKGILAPLVIRNASKTLRTIPRGSRVSLSKKSKIIRLFIYWKNITEYNAVDVDLSAVMYDEKFEQKASSSWQRLTGDGYSHSGDIRSAPNGAAEFIDLDIQRLLDCGIRYVVSNVISFTGVNFEQMGAFTGFMERQSLSSGEAFEPKTVQDKFDLSGETTDVSPFLFDLVTREIIWLDISNGSKAYQSVRGPGGTGNQLAKIAKSIIAMESNTPNMFDIITLQAEARGATVDNVKQSGVKYDEVFDLDRVKDISDITANWLK